MIVPDSLAAVGSWDLLVSPWHLEERFLTCPSVDCQAWTSRASAASEVLSRRSLALPAVGRRAREIAVGAFANEPRGDNVLARSD